MLLAASPPEEKRLRRWLVPLVAIPILWVLTFLFLAFRLGWWFLLGVPLAYFVISAEVFILAPFMEAPTRTAIKVIELTGDAATPLDLIRKRLTHPVQGKHLVLQLLDRFLDRANIRRLTSEVKKLGYRTESVPDA
jgi:hypothetical protein